MVFDELDCSVAYISCCEIVSQVLAGLDLDYNPVVLALAAWVEPVSVQELYTQLLSFDAQLNILHGMNVRHSSANAASRGRGTGRGRDHQGRNRGGDGRGRGNGSGARLGGSGYTNTNAPARSGGGGFNNNHASSGSSSNNRVRCQLCKKPGHEVDDPQV